MGDAGEPTLLHVHDLPQLYSKPSASTLLSTLELLKQNPHSLSIGAVHDHGDSSPSASQHISIDPTGIPRYLTSIISSPLQWIPDENSRERIWETASLRLSERSGRTALPSLTRTFEIPVSSSKKPTDDHPESQSHTDAATSTSTVLLHLHEPSLTSDHLGFKTWTSSVLLSRRLHTLGYHLPQKGTSTTVGNPPLRILELGSGTGLLGLSAACAFSASSVLVTLTDLPPIIPNLQSNTDRNLPTILQHSSTCTVRVMALDWSDHAHHPKDESEKYDVILAADPLYSPEHPMMLVDTVGRWIRRPPSRSQMKEEGEEEDRGGCFIVCLPLREGYGSEREEMKERLSRKLGMRVVDGGNESGLEDWEDSRGRKREVVCEWGVWRFR